MASSPGTETLEGPGAGPFILACESEDNVTEGNGGPRASQHQAEALGKGMEKEKTHTNRPSHPGRKGKDKSILRSHGTALGEQEEDQSSLRGQGHGSSPQEYNILSVTQQGCRRSQKLRRS